MSKRALTFMTDDPQPLRDRALLASSMEPELTLGTLLADHPALCTEPLTADHLQLPVHELKITVLEPRPDRAGYLPPGIVLGPGVGLGAGPGGTPVDPPTAPSEPTARTARTAPAGPTVAAGADLSGSEAGTPTEVAADGQHPQQISDREAVLLAHREDIDRAASYLESGLSVLVRADKILVSHLAEEIAVRSGRVTRTVRLDRSARPDAPSAGLPGLPSSRRSELLDALIEGLATARSGELVVVPHLDLLAGGSDATLNAEARELADAVYEAADCVLLAFFDPSLTLPEVLASRFAVRLPIDILPRQVATPAGLVPSGRALVTQAEADLFEGFDETGLYKHIAGLNAVRLRHALQYAAHQHRTPATAGQDRAPATTCQHRTPATAGQDRAPATTCQHRAPATAGQDAGRPTFGRLVAELQTFKAKTSSSFEVPNVSFDDIGGYQAVKDELQDALEIVGGAAQIPERLRTDLVPAGFIFHGPPGTGKTLFAKAAATALGATILVVSGPEITDKYVGESERKIRDIFAEARRNAPSVIVFDEFDSIAARRTGSQSDGGARAGNAVVAQLLTELDGFRPEVPVLIIGTTNRLDIIDEALLRPSRFRPIEIGPPEVDARREIAARHARHFGVEVSERLLDHIATSTQGCSGDDIRSLFRDARAGELVGARRPADAARLGQVLGELRRARRQREAGRSGPAPVDGARRPQQAPVALVTRRRAATAPAATAPATGTPATGAPVTGRQPGPAEGDRQPGPAGGEGTS